jgi:hypothetical protein
MISYPIKYLPSRLTRKDRKKEAKYLAKSRKLYKKGKYFVRPKISSFKSKTSKHILKARKTYSIQDISPSKELANKTGCSIEALAKIVNKGEGAYYSSGSRPNQTAQSWGYARLASAITGGKSAAVDFNILQNGCKPNSKALKLAKQAVKKHKYGTRRVPRTFINNN